MRTNIVAGNWKMNTTVEEGVKLVSEIVEKSKDLSNVKLIVAPPFTHIFSVGEKIRGTATGLSAQNCASEAKGAFTGEVSSEMLASLNVEYVIIGHSERREYYKESDEILLKKIKLALASGISPIFCAGENLAEREANRHFEVVKKQIEEVVFKINETDFEKIIIAYEPVWAIGTGKTATAEQAQEIHAYIRKVLSAKFGEKAENTSILYGGSCKPGNAKEIFSKPDVDGGLIGGASLNADEFIAIAKSF
ncbi:MAG: triose-phosphate isomerase [Prevotellaceae bacterium]|jgi:triosephosphate isomerase|nr:triose-phosphate isomerase [Prevotellaceae bacterium]